MVTSLSLLPLAFTPQNIAFGLLISVLLFGALMASRGFWCWYFKLNEFLSVLQAIQGQLETLNSAAKEEMELISQAEDSLVEDEPAPQPQAVARPADKPQPSFRSAAAVRVQESGNYDEPIQLERIPR